MLLDQHAYDQDTLFLLAWLLQWYADLRKLAASCFPQASINSRKHKHKHMSNASIDNQGNTLHLKSLRTIAYASTKLSCAHQPRHQTPNQSFFRALILTNINELEALHSTNIESHVEDTDSVVASNVMCSSETPLASSTSTDNATPHDNTSLTTDTIQTFDNATPHDNMSFTNDSTRGFGKAELLRQVEYYFSDENLQRDAHLLGKLEEGNGSVSIAQVTGWKQMRKFRPLGAVKEALKESTVIEIINNKRIRRREPFDMAKAKVKPRVDEEERKQRQTATLKANPHLTKGMLKRTGFEHDHVEPTLTTEEQQTELERYSIDHPIYDRLQEAVLRYKMNRTLHQETLRVFHAFLNYGGFDERPSGFSGGATKEEEEGLSKEEKAIRKQINFVSEDVIQSLDGTDGKWVVDFEGVTKGFFSTPFPVQFLWHDDLEHDKEVTNAACNVLRNFFNYLLHHNVCAEYVDQIESAKDALKLVEHEYAKLAQVQIGFPGSFSIACSTLLGGYYSEIGYRGDWLTPEEAAGAKTGFSDDEARSIVCAGLAACETNPEKLAALQDSYICVVEVEEEIGLEVTSITLAAETSQWAQAFFDKLKGTVVAPMGKLLCKGIHFQKAAPLDLPIDHEEGPQSFEFLMDENTLQNCFLGMKLIATVHRTNSGLWFIDHWSECHGTFYTWCWNERAREYKEYIDNFKLARLKHRTNGEHIVPVSNDRMLKEHAYGEEQATTLLREKADNE